MRGSGDGGGGRSSETPGDCREPEPGVVLGGPWLNLDYTVEVANDFSLAFTLDMTVLHLKMAICQEITYLQPGDLRCGTQSDRLSDGCLLLAIPGDIGDVVVINDGR